MSVCDYMFWYVCIYMRVYGMTMYALEYAEEKHFMETLHRVHQGKGYGEEISLFFLYMTLVLEYFTYT